MPARIEFTNKQDDEIVMMYQYGFSSCEIAEWFGVSSDRILKQLKEKECSIRPAAHLRDKRKNYVKRDIPSPWKNVDAAYVFGVLIGDASLQYRYYLGEKRNPKGISLDTSDKEFVNSSSRALKSAFGIDPGKYPGDRNDIIVTAYSVDLGELYDRFRWRTEAWRVPDQFSNAPRDIKVALCQGKLDSDGTIEERAITISSIHKPGLESLREVVEDLGYQTTLRGPYEYEEENWQDEHSLRISDASPELFRLRRKKRKLKQ